MACHMVCHMVCHTVHFITLFITPLITCRCMRELRAAADLERKIVFVCETVPEKGAVSLPAELSALAKESMRSFVVHEYVAPFAKRCITWEHIKPFLEVSLLELARELVDPKYLAKHKTDPLVLSGSVVSRNRVNLPRVPAGVAHVFVSAHNEGAMAYILHELQSQPGFKRTPLRVQTLREDGGRGADGRRGACSAICGLRTGPLAASSVFFLYLDGRTWGASGRNPRERTLQEARRVGLARDVAMAMDLQMNVLLAHEFEGPQVVPFVDLLRDTPAALVEWGLYAAGAIKLQAGIYRPVSAHLAAAELANLLEREPKEWEAARMAGGAVWALEGREDGGVAAAVPFEAEEEGNGAGVDAEDEEGTGLAAVAEQHAESFMEAGFIVSGVDDLDGMAVNPVQLKRMQEQMQEAKRHASSAARSAPLQFTDVKVEVTSSAKRRPGQWGKLGIDLRAGSKDNAGISQLKKLEKFLAKEQGVALPTAAEEAAAEDTDLAAPERSMVIKRASLPRIASCGRFLLPDAKSAEPP